LISLLDLRQLLAYFSKGDGLIPHLSHSISGGLASSGCLRHQVKQHAPAENQHYHAQEYAVPKLPVI
jgi:hypothetical protein